MTTRPKSDRARPEGNDPERDLSDGFLFGDQDAHRLVDHWIARVVQHRAWRLGSETEDLAQETKLRVVRLLSTQAFRGDSSLKTFVQTVAKHVCLDAVRRARVRSTVDLSEEHSAPQHDYPDVRVDRKESARLCYSVLRRLPDTCREIFRRILVDEMGYEQIAADLGISTGTVKSRLARCRDRAVALRRALGGDS